MSSSGKFGLISFSLIICLAVLKCQMMLSGCRFIMACKCSVAEKSSHLVEVMNRKALFCMSCNFDLLVLGELLSAKRTIDREWVNES